MDALSDLLRVVRLSGGVFLDAEFSAPWCIAARVGPEDCRMVMAEPARVIAVHYVVAGRLLLQVGGEPPIELRSGAIALLPRNDDHTLASHTGLPPVSGDHLIQAHSHGDLARIRYGGGGETTHIVCGFVGTEARHHPLIDALPPTLVLDLKLSELLFVEAVRHYVETLPANRTGWLAGLRDPVVGRALALLHTQLARGWTAEALAREVFLSRSAFADRFTAVIGVRR
jgi:hypothetical protein